MLAYTNSVTTQHSQVLLQNGIHSANYLSPGGGGGGGYCSLFRDSEPIRLVEILMSPILYTLIFNIPILVRPMMSPESVCKS